MAAEVFIAYSKEDAAWRQRLTTMLAPLVQFGLSAWDDTHIQPGQHRQQAIAAAIAEARVAVLLVSAEFLASDFLGQELSTILADAHRNKGLRILWVPVRPCLWRETALSAYEPVHDAGKSLSTLADADSALAQICTRIKDAVVPVSTGDARRRNPYMGLSAFRTEESHLFFGRESLTQQLCKNFQALFDKPGAIRILTIVGPSGSGKSSVARAGLLAALSRSSVAGAQPPRTVIIRPGPRPIESLARTLVPLLPSETAVLPASRALAIEELLRSSSAGIQGLRRFADNLPQIDQCPLILLVDQFEEVYTLCTDQKERNAFVELLLHAASEQTRHVAVVLTLRSDFLGETQRHHNPLNRLIAAQAVIVPAMSPEELREAIVKPAEGAGRPIDETTVELLLTESRGSHGALPLLEFALTRIWEGMERGEEPGTTLRKLGGVGGALAGEAQKIYGSLAEPEKETARRALVRLVQLGEGQRDTRRRSAIQELCGRGETSEMVLSVLRRFATDRARLVTLADDGAEVMAEVTHEALFEHWKELRSWIDESRADRHFHDRAAAATRLWQEAGRPPGRLWRPPDLYLLRDYQRRKPQELGSLQAEFLAAALRRQRQEKLLGVGAALAVLSVLIVAAGIYVTKERQRLHEERRRTQEIHGKLLDSYIARGRQRLFDNGDPSEGLLWLHRAQGEECKDFALSHLLRSAMQSVDATHAVLSGHSTVVLSATFSPHGRRIVTTSEDATARVWEAEGGRLVAELKGHTSGVLSATFSPDSRRIVTASRDNTARVWDAEGGRLVAELKGHKSGVTSVTFSPDGLRIVSASWDKTARVWEAETGRFVTEFKGHEYGVNSAAFSPDGLRILTAGMDNTARVWEAEGGRLVAELKGHRGSVGSATFSPDGLRIVTVSMDTAQVWDAESGRLLAELKGHGSSVLSAAFSPDGLRIVTASEDKTARVWGAEGGRLLAELKGHGAYVTNAVFSPDGLRIVTASGDKTARVWDAEHGRLLEELKGHGDGLISAKFSPDGLRIVTASRDNTARVWESEDRWLVAELKGHKDKLTSATYSIDGHRIVTVSEDKTVRVWESEGGRLVTEFNIQWAVVDSATHSSDGSRIVTTSSIDGARVWDAETGRLVAQLEGHESNIHNVKFRPDGRRIVAVSEDEKVLIWNAETGRLVASLKGFDAKVNSETFSPDGRHIVTASKDNTARVWDAADGRLVAELKGHKAQVVSATYNSFGHRIVTASEDNTALVWEAETGRLIAELKGHGSSVNSATFSHDDRRIVTVSDDNTARVWDAETGRLVAELKSYGFRVHSATFSPDGARIVTAGEDSTARVWETKTGQLLAELKGHTDSITGAMFSPDGRRIVTASADHMARVWDTSPEIRTYEQLGKLIRCHVPASFEQEKGNIIVFRMPTPAECLQDAHHSRAFEQNVINIQTGKDGIKNYKQLEARAVQESARIKKDYGLTIQILINPEYLSTADVATLAGVEVWIKVITAAVGEMVQQGKFAEVRKNIGIIGILPFKGEELKSGFARSTGGITITQSLANLSKSPPVDFSAQLRRAILEVTTKEKHDSALAKLAPLRGKITAPLSQIQSSQLALLSVNIAMMKVGNGLLGMQELEKDFQSGTAQPLAKLSKDDPTLLARKVNATLASLPKDVAADFTRAQKETYADSAALQAKLRTLLTDSLLKEGLELLSSRPAGFPDLSAKLTLEELWKGILLYHQDWEGLPDATYLDRLSTWESLMHLKKS